MRKDKIQTLFCDVEQIIESHPFGDPNEKVKRNRVLISSDFKTGQKNNSIF